MHSTADLTAAIPGASLALPHVASPSQRRAIEADPGPVLVLAGPGAGKTFCLIERIRFLIERLDFDPARICAFTFTNKAADEIAARLGQLGPRAELAKRGTLHAFCAEVLREFGSEVGVEPGFGIADEEYQRGVLARLRVPMRWHGNVLKRFAALRFRGDPLRGRDAGFYERYRHFLERRNLLDFDMLVLEAAALMRDSLAAVTLRKRWDYVLVDEFQDLNRSQYAVVRELARDHRNIFAVGDDEQSIYSWAGADTKVFRDFSNDFGLASKMDLRENHRCPHDVFTLARTLVMNNAPVFEDRLHADGLRDSAFPVTTLTFADDAAELEWIVADLRRDREAHGLAWGDAALLYRKHQIGEAIEASFLAAGIPCRMAHGRALADDPVVGYVIAALRVIASPHDPVHKECFLSVVLPRALLAEARVRAEDQSRTLLNELHRLGRELPKEHGAGRKIRRGLYALQNLQALGTRHTSLTALVEELLSQRVGVYRSTLETHHDDLTDPAEHDEVRNLGAQISSAISAGSVVWIPALGGAEIPLKAILLAIGVRVVITGGARRAGAVAITSDDAPSLGLPLALFKAAQLVRGSAFSNEFRDFTAVDIETTDKDIATSEVVELAAVRVRDGEIVDQYHTLVKPRVPIAEGAARTHGLRDTDVAGAPFFEDVWPAFREFCGSDVLVAHNGYEFDFPILRRMAKTLPGGGDLVTYDTLPLAREIHPASRKLRDLARAYGVDPGTSHRALDDTRTLARVFLGLGEANVARARKTALVHLLDHLGVALALSDQDTLVAEARTLADLARPFALGRYSECLEFYRSERDRIGDPALPTVDQVIDRLGGAELMARIQAQKTADQRYPGAMVRLRRMLDQCGDGPLDARIATFLERAVLSRWDGAEPEKDRVNLLTLHSTKGLEFSRVYVVGAEDGQLPGGSPSKGVTKEEMEEARRLLYVGMTRTQERLVLTRAEVRNGKPTGGHQFLDEMGLTPRQP